MLRQVMDLLEDVAGASLSIVVEGLSHRPGPKPELLKSALDFKLVGIETGSTYLPIKAPVLKDSLEEIQTSLFGVDRKSIQDQSGVDLAIETLSQAYGESKRDDLLDRYVLKKILKSQSLVEGNMSLELRGSVNNKVILNEKKLSKVKTLEKHTPPERKVKAVGILDVLSHSKRLIKLKTQKGVIRSHLAKSNSFKDLMPHFGKKVTVIGIASYKPSGKIDLIEIQEVRPLQGDEEEEIVNQLTIPIDESLDVRQLRREKQGEWGDIVGAWPGDESIDDLMELLDDGSD